MKENIKRMRGGHDAVLKRVVKLVSGQKKQFERSIHLGEQLTAVRKHLAECGSTIMQY